MISIIIASVNKAQLQEVKNNIEATIGTPYEVIAFDNSNGERGLCEIYNEGAKNAKYDLLCFMHEDIQFKSMGWGKQVYNKFESYSELKLVGLAGSTYKSLTPSSWMSPGVDEKQCQVINLIQKFRYQNLPEKHLYNNPAESNITKVASVDGVWFCTTKATVIDHPFDQKLLKKFHGYDLDFSLNILGKFDTAVVFDILIEHFSEGNFNDTWMEEILKVHKKWARKLPSNLVNFDKKTILKAEKENFRDLLCKNRISPSMAFSLLWGSWSYVILSPKLFIRLNYFAAKAWYNSVFNKC